MGTGGPRQATEKTASWVARAVGGAVVLVVAAAAGWFLASRFVADPADPPPSAPPEEPLEPPVALARKLLIVDTHIDLPYRLVEESGARIDVSQRSESGNFDGIRAREGGLDVAWMSIYVPAELQKEGGAKAFADARIDSVEAIARQHPAMFAIPTGADDALRIARSGRIALPMGMENGAGIEDDLANLAHFHARGVRYITLTHGEDNLIADSSYSDAATRRWQGLSQFGKDVVKRMNELGILVDLSHVSDAAFDEALDATAAPPILSHSSCRHFTPGFERNLDDDRIRALAKKGGVIQINFGSSFLTASANFWMSARRDAEERFIAASGAAADSPEVKEFERAYDAEHPLPRATVDDVVAHIEHVVTLVGLDHVGLGSDFDGVGPTLPIGLEDVSKYPALIARFLERGYSDDAIAKIVGENLMRVWREAERLADAPTPGSAGGSES